MNDNEIMINVSGYRVIVKEENGFFITTIFGEIIQGKTMKELIDNLKKYIDDMGF